MYIRMAYTHVEWKPFTKFLNPEPGPGMTLAPVGLTGPGMPGQCEAGFFWCKQAFFFFAYAWVFFFERIRNGL